jgi:hypothetical protein
MTPRAATPLVLVALALAGCAGIPMPLPGGHPPRGAPGYVEPLPVPGPPEPGRVEIIPPRPPGLQHPVWIDGQWVWTGRRWQWKEGGWEEQLPGRYYAPPIYVRLDDGSMFYVPGAWTNLPASK